MSKADNLTDFLTDVADAIRYSSEKSDKIQAQEFSNEIRKFKLSGIEVSLTSGATISGDNLDKIKLKQQRLSHAINGTVIDGETVYKITYQVEDDNSVDTIFYTKEGDAAGYYYVLGSLDNFLNKVTETSVISFTVEDTSYTAINGMTWEDWINSEYNINGFDVDDFGCVSSDSGRPVIRNTGQFCLSSDKIIANYNYSTSYTAGGGSDD